MAEGDRHGAPPDSANRGWEVQDADPRAIIKFGIGLAISTVLIVFFLAWLFGILARRDVTLTQPISAVSEPVREPPAPRLQVNPYSDVGTLRQHEEQVLSSYGWVDKSAGVVRIPIERAMGLVAQRGIPPATALAEGKGAAAPPPPGAMATQVRGAPGGPKK